MRVRVRVSIRGGLRRKLRLMVRLELKRRPRPRLIGGRGACVVAVPACW